jgi:hypothetical protein
VAACCHAELALLYRDAGSSGEAQDRVTIATAIYQERSMAYRLEKAPCEFSAPA